MRDFAVSKFFAVYIFQLILKRKDAMKRKNFFGFFAIFALVHLPGEHKKLKKKIDCRTHLAAFPGQLEQKFGIAMHLLQYKLLPKMRIKNN